MIKLYKVDLSVDISYKKTLRLKRSEDDVNCVSVKLNQLDEDYEEYMKPVLEYFKGDVNLKELLEVDNIVPMGAYIRGIFGGEKKEGKKPYAGLVFEVISKDQVKNVYLIRLRNINKDLEVPASELEKHWFKLIYRGEVHPFYLRKTYNILLSDSGKSGLTKFLRLILLRNKNKLKDEEKDMIEILIDEVKQPSKIPVLNGNKYYVVYRGKRTFSAVAVIQTKPKTVVKDETGYIEVSSKQLAFYYSAILNYLAYKTEQLNLPVIRDQYSRPINAIIEAGLPWKDSIEIRKTVVELSEKIHQKAVHVFKNKQYRQEKQYFKNLANDVPEFRKLVEIIDNYISKTIGEDELINILSCWVAGKG